MNISSEWFAQFTHVHFEVASMRLTGCLAGLGKTPLDSVQTSFPGTKVPEEEVTKVPEEEVHLQTQLQEQRVSADAVPCNSTPYNHQTVSTATTHSCLWAKQEIYISCRVSWTSFYRVSPSNIGYSPPPPPPPSKKSDIEIGHCFPQIMYTPIQE